MNNDEIKESLNNLFGYHSPIELIVGEINTQFENDCVTMIQNYGIDINKEELVRALNYDRDQYHKGFQDAKELYEPKKGKWIDHSDETILFGGVTYTPPFTCSECGKTALNEPWWYCPNCGADMREADDDN